MTWTVEVLTGGAGELHRRQIPSPACRRAWFFQVDRPALVLGSTQPDDVADLDACAALGVEVVRRRSGGGAVLVLPGDALWLDLIVPRHDPLWSDDVGRATHWVGELWAAALGDVGVPEPAVHRGGLVRAPWSDLVCFAGLGPGEVSVAGTKVVGISQRRTRETARFQCVALARWDPGPLLDLLALDGESLLRAEVDLVDSAAGVPLAGLARTLRDRLPAPG